MYEILNLFKQKPIPKFQQTLINFEKPQNFSKSSKPRFQNMKCMKNEKKREHTKWFEARRVRKSRGLKVLREKIVFGRWKVGSVEREIEKNERQIALNIYIGVQ